MYIQVRPFTLNSDVSLPAYESYSVILMFSTVIGSKNTLFHKLLLCSLQNIRFPIRKWGRSPFGIHPNVVVQLSTPSSHIPLLGKNTRPKQRLRRIQANKRASRPTKSLTKTSQSKKCNRTVCRFNLNVGHVKRFAACHRTERSTKSTLPMAALCHTTAAPTFFYNYISLTNKRIVGLRISRHFIVFLASIFIVAMEKCPLHVHEAHEIRSVDGYGRERIPAFVSIAKYLLTTEPAANSNEFQNPILALVLSEQISQRKHID